MAWKVAIGFNIRSKVLNIGQVAELFPVEFWYIKSFIYIFIRHERQQLKIKKKQEKEKERKT